VGKKSSTPQPVSKGYRPLREGYQPRYALGSTPPKGGSGMKIAPSVTTNSPLQVPVKKS